MTRYELRDAVRERKEELRGRVEGEQETGAALAWTPTIADLSDEARHELERRLAGVGKRHRLGYESGWLACLVATDQAEAFKEWRV